MSRFLKHARGEDLTCYLVPNLGLPNRSQFVLIDVSLASLAIIRILAVNFQFFGIQLHTLFFTCSKLF